MGLGALGSGGGEEEQEQHKRRMIGTTADSAITIRLWSVVGCTGEPRHSALVTLPLVFSSAKRDSTVSYINAADGTLTMYSVLPAATSISALLLRKPPFAPFLCSSVSCEKERCGNFITILWPGQVWLVGSATDGGGAWRRTRREEQRTTIIINVVEREDRGWMMGQRQCMEGGSLVGRGREHKEPPRRDRRRREGGGRVENGGEQ